MKRFLLSLALVAAPITPALADQIPLDDLSRYFAEMGEVRSDFTQINSDGTVSTGALMMHRPGRMRFEYNDQDLLVIAGSQQLAIFDGRSNSRGEQYRLRDTPLWLILQRDVDLSRSDMVVSHSYDGTSTRVVAQDPDRPETGSLTLVFTSEPVELRQWIVTDNTGAETTVILGSLERDVTLPSRLFSIRQEILDRAED
jgi:outer membrane lipoprotein-sorting protein